MIQLQTTLELTIYTKAEVRYLPKSSHMEIQPLLLMEMTTSTITELSILFFRLNLRILMRALRMLRGMMMMLLLLLLMCILIMIIETAIQPQVLLKEVEMHLISTLLFKLAQG